MNKYQRAILENQDTKALKKFIEANKNNKIGKTKYGIMITKYILKKEDNIYYIPYYCTHSTM